MIWTTLAFDDLTTNANCSASTNFQTEHECTNTTSPIMCDVPVQTNLTLNRNISGENF